MKGKILKNKAGLYPLKKTSPLLKTLPWSAPEGQMVKATSPSIKQDSLPQLVRHLSEESKAEETHKKGKMITIKK